ncbi:MAG: NAD(P)H-dependent oxidoreductase [Erythrobacter sp.]
MSHVLFLSASIQGDQSTSRTLGKKLVDRLVAEKGANVSHRDLSANSVPFISADHFAANNTPADARTPQQSELAAIADALIAELQAADTIVMSVPIYNFGVPASVKAWADMVARAGTTFHYTAEGPVGQLTGKKVYLTVASGGTPIGSDFDHMTPWLTFFLGFLGLTDVEVIAADGIMGEGGEEKIAEAHEKIAQLAL